MRVRNAEIFEVLGELQKGSIGIAVALVGNAVKLLFGGWLAIRKEEGRRDGNGKKKRNTA